MVDMELVIKVSKEDYKSIKKYAKKFLSKPGYKVPTLYAAVNAGIIPPKGRWVPIQRGKYIDICCSKCSNARFKRYAYGYTIDDFNFEKITNDLIAKIRVNYCECCGAKMQPYKAERERMNETDN